MQQRAACAGGAGGGRCGARFDRDPSDEGFRSRRPPSAGDSAPLAHTGPIDDPAWANQPVKLTRHATNPKHSHQPSQQTANRSPSAGTTQRGTRAATADNANLREPGDRWHLADASQKAASPSEIDAVLKACVVRTDANLVAILVPLGPRTSTASVLAAIADRLSCLRGHQLAARLFRGWAELRCVNSLWSLRSTATKCGTVRLRLLPSNVAHPGIR
jgi:hypothetical protein